VDRSRIKLSTSPGRDSNPGPPAVSQICYEACAGLHPLGAPTGLSYRGVRVVSYPFLNFLKHLLD
jgi:hypothetical protein